MNIDIQGAVTFRAALAIKVWTAKIGAGVDGVWFPGAQIVISGLAPDALGPATITLPKMLALERGLI